MPPKVMALLTGSPEPPPPPPRPPPLTVEMIEAMESKVCPLLRRRLPTIRIGLGV